MFHGTSSFAIAVVWVKQHGCNIIPAGQSCCYAGAAHADSKCHYSRNRCAHAIKPSCYEDDRWTCSTSGSSEHKCRANGAPPPQGAMRCLSGRVEQLALAVTGQTRQPTLLTGSTAETNGTALDVLSYGKDSNPTGGICLVITRYSPWLRRRHRRFSPNSTRVSGGGSTSDSKCSSQLPKQSA